MQPADPARAPRAREQCSRGQVRACADRGAALILGAVIAGGAARRFGSDKALALVAGKRLIDHAADALRPHADALAVCGRELEGWTSLADLPRPGLGPLGGIAAALAYAEAHGFVSVLTIGCDMPDVPGALVESLVATLPSYCADAPILGHWPADEAQTLTRHAGLVRASTVEPGGAGIAAHPGGPRNESGVTKGGKSAHLSIRRWAESIGATAIPAPRPLANINSPADLATP